MIEAKVTMCVVCRKELWTRQQVCYVDALKKPYCLVCYEKYKRRR